MTYFFDNCLSPSLVNILKELGVDAVHLKEKFPADTLDVDWIPEAGREGWIVVTSDVRIRRNSAEREALAKHRVTTLFLQKTFLKRTIWPQALWLLKNWQGIEKAAEQLPRGASATVTDGGKLERLS